MLSQQQIRQFRDQGYLVVEDVVDDGTLAAIRTEYASLMDRLFAQWHAQGKVKGAPENLDFWGKLDRCLGGSFDWYQPFDISLPHDNIAEDTPMHFGPAVFDLVTHARVLDIVESLIGPEITSNPIQHVRIKPPQRALQQSEVRAHITSTDWHQDQGVTLEEADETEFVTIWVAITDATVENGCLQVAPGPRNEMLPHCSKTQVGIADVFVPADTAVPAPVGAGGVVLFHPLTPHASLPNESNGYRWSFDLRYNVTGQPTGRSHFPEFVARSRSDPASELQDWKVWRQMWRDTRHRLAVGPHVPQHRWPSDSPYCA